MYFNLVLLFKLGCELNISKTKCNQNIFFKVQYNFGRPLCQGANIDRAKEECLCCIAIQMGQLTILMMEKIEIHEEFVTKRFYIFCNCNCNCVSGLNMFINKCFVCKKGREPGS